MTRVEVVQELARLGYTLLDEVGGSTLSRDDTKVWIHLYETDSSTEYKVQKIGNFSLGKKYVPEVEPNRDKISTHFYSGWTGYRFRVDGSLVLNKRIQLGSGESEQHLKQELDSYFDSIHQLETSKEKDVFAGGSSPFSVEPIRPPNIKTRVGYLDGMDAAALNEAWNFRSRGGSGSSGPVWIERLDVQGTKILWSDAHPSRPEGERIGFELRTELASATLPDDGKVDWSGFDLHGLSLSRENKPQVWCFISLEQGLELGEIKLRLERFAEICKQLSKS